MDWIYTSVDAVEWRLSECPFLCRRWSCSLLSWPVISGRQWAARCSRPRWARGWSRRSTASCEVYSSPSAIGGCRSSRRTSVCSTRPCSAASCGSCRRPARRRSGTESELPCAIAPSVLSRRRRRRRRRRQDSTERARRRCELTTSSGCDPFLSVRAKNVSTSTSTYHPLTVHTHCIIIIIIVFRTFLSRDAMHKRGLCRRAMSIRLFVRSSVRHIRVLCQNEQSYPQNFAPSGNYRPVLYLLERSLGADVDCVRNFVTFLARLRRNTETVV